MNPAAIVAAMQSDSALSPVFQGLDPAVATDLAQRIQAYAQRARGQVVPHVDAGPTGQRFRLWNNYYSVVRFQAQVDVNGAITTLTFPAQELRPFNYRIGDALGVAGFDPTFGNATEAETNLVKANETVAGEQLEVDGISLMPTGETDMGLWLKLSANIAVKISMDGDAHQYRLGRMEMIPGSGGTFGSGLTSTQAPPLNSSTPQANAFSNGWPTIDNFYPFPDPIIWTPSGETDSNFNVVLKLVRQQIFVETARLAADGVAPFTPPTGVNQFGSFIDVMCRLHSLQAGARSVNQ